MEKDTRTEFEKMDAGEMFWNSDAKIGELKSTPADLPTI